MNINLPPHTSLQMPPKEAAVIPPEGGWKENTYYVVDVSYEAHRPICRSILYVGLLGEKDPLMGKGSGLMATNKYDLYDFDLDQLHFIRAVCEIPQMKHTTWQPIDTAPKNNERLLYLAVIGSDGEIQQLDYDGIWQSDSESWELPEVYYYWASAEGIEEPTHWAYQDDLLPTLNNLVRDKQLVEATVQAFINLCEQGIDYPMCEADEVQGNVCAALIKLAKQITPQQIINFLEATK